MKRILLHKPIVLSLIKKYIKRKNMSKKITGQSIWLSAGNDGGSIDGHIL